MRRRDFLLVSAATLVIPGARAQKRTPVIGLLGTDSAKPSLFARYLLEGLRERGWVDGRDLRVDDRVMAEGSDAYAENVAALLRAHVDLIVANGATATFAAAKATKEIPIVMNVGIDPVATGLVASFSRPGGNVTGIVNLSPLLNAKRLELLKELNPRLSSVGVLVTAGVGNPSQTRDLEAAGRAFNVQMHFSQARTADELDGAIADLAKLKVGALLIAPSTLFNAQSTRIVEAVTRHRIAAVYSNMRFVESGALLVYDTPSVKNWLRMAAYVDRILRGARPSEMAIEQPRDVELVVNLNAAKALGLKIPQAILMRADRVIE